MDLGAELEHEHHYLQEAYRFLAVMRERTRRVVEEGEFGDSVDEEILRAELRDRLSRLQDTNSPLTFGRIDSDGGDTFYIGRRHVRDDHGDPVVIDWRAPVATPFYRATIHDPLDLRLRRRFVLDGRALVDLFDEDFTDPDSLVEGGHGGVPDPLLAELGRARTGQMRDIVATIQAEQDEIIRAPLRRVIAVQGGPGTGKTAVGLHRAAFLLYEHRRFLEREKVLIIGPNRLFLEYISQVLPSLGETAVYQTTVDALGAMEFRARREDPPDVARLKGDPRMPVILRRALWRQVRPADAPLSKLVAGIRLHAAAEELDTLVREARIGGAPYRAARDAFQQRLGRFWLTGNEVDIYAAGLDAEDFVARILRAPDVKKALDRLWPPINPTALVRSLLTNRAKLKGAAAGLLSDQEMGVLQSKNARALRDEGWSRSDLPLLDEAEWLVTGAPQTYGHTIVDEAQDLSAMQLRMVRRRTLHASMTLLGDLAQGTAAASQSSWEDVLGYLGETGGEIATLSVGYRVPEAILTLANRLLPIAAPDVPPTSSVRRTGDPPRLIHAPTDLAGRAAMEADELAALWDTVGVVCSLGSIEPVREALRDRAVDFVSWEQAELDHPVTLLDALASKGLEFDAVVVVDPTGVYDEENGPRRLYVAMTRAVQHLSLIHSAGLPEALVGDGAAEAQTA
ncbi:MAG: AAA family ATPase [Actinomycetota bacterium]|nr:AAA family ATPase [Actinomycetota bacterium]